MDNNAPTRSLPHLIAAIEPPASHFHWRIRTVCGVCVDDAVYMEAVLRFGEQRVATADLSKVACTRCLAEVAAARLFANLCGGDFTAAMEIQRERNRLLSMQIEVIERAGVTA